MNLSRPSNMRLGIILLLVGLTVAACTSNRPSVSEWESDWHAAVGLIPDESFLDDDPTEACQEVLVSLREQKETLFPAPDELVAASVRQWLEAAEGTFFDCPPADGFSDAFARLDELEAEVDAGLSSPAG